MTPEDLAEAERALEYALQTRPYAKAVQELALHFARVRTEAYARGVEEGRKEGPAK